MGLLGQSSNDGQPLLYNKWVKANKNRADKTQLVTEIKLSQSEEWILILTSESIAMMKADSKMGKEFWHSLQEFGGIGKALIIYPEKSKLGFDLDFHETKKAQYSWEDDSLIIDSNLKKKKPSGLKITWKNASTLDSSSDVTQELDTSNTKDSEDLDSSLNQEPSKHSRSTQSKKKTGITSGSMSVPNPIDTKPPSTPLSES